MVVENQLFAAEAEIRWLDQVEASVRRYGRPDNSTSEVVADERVENRR